MKCLQKLYSSPSWLVVSLCLLCTLFLTMINTSNVSAVSDFTYTFDLSSIPSWYLVCGDSSSDPVLCSDYTYVVVTPNTTYSNLSYFIVSAPGINANISVSSSVSSIIPLSSFSKLWLTGGKSGNAIGTITLTFTDSICSCPPVTPCPEIPEYPYTDQLDEIKQAIILVPAVCLVIYFFYAIYKMIMGGVRR